jgi:ribosomal subunit interface protein
LAIELGRAIDYNTKWVVWQVLVSRQVVLIDEGITAWWIFTGNLLRRTKLLFTITGKHIEVTEALKEHARKKTSKLSKFYSSINQVEVIIDREQGGSSLSVEIIARGEHSKVFVAKEVSEDAYQSIDVAIHKLERQLRRAKTRERNNKHPGNI